MSAPRISRAKSSQAALLAALHKQSFEAGWAQAEIQSHIDNPIDDVLTLWQEDIIAGFIICRTAIDQSEIITLAIDPSYRSLGHGLSLVNAAHEAAKTRGANIVFLDVAEDNEAGRALYRKAGYFEYARRPGYYKRKNGRFAALLLQRKL